MRVHWRGRLVAIEIMKERKIIETKENEGCAFAAEGAEPTKKLEQIGAGGAETPRNHREIGAEGAKQYVEIGA